MRLSKPSDEYLTPPDVAAWANKLIGGPFAFDPYGHPAQFVQVLDRNTQTLPDGVWPNSGNMWANPPYSLSADCVTKLAAWYLAAPAHRTVLALLLAAPGSAYWRDSIWPHALVAFPNRMRFWALAAGCGEPGVTADVSTRDLAFVLWTADRKLQERFISDARMGRMQKGVKIEPCASVRAGGR